MEERGRLQGTNEYKDCNLSAPPEVQTQNNYDYNFAGWILEIIPYLIAGIDRLDHLKGSAVSVEY